jgi:hypothetical protein
MSKPIFTGGAKWEMGITDPRPMEDDDQDPYRVEAGTESIAAQVRLLWPYAEVVINPALGEWGWLAFAKGNDA